MLLADPVERGAGGPAHRSENFGQVFSGSFRGDRVAVKKLPPETHENDDHVDSFVAEVKITVTLNQSKNATLWMAPEVIRDEMYSTDADMFWFSVVLSELDMPSALYAQARQQICDSSWCPLQQADILQEVTMGSLRVFFSESGPMALAELGLVLISGSVLDVRDTDTHELA
ncbi:hypothetical protein ON010_g7770 [Phytophthora cinnamomi]|nr:hypothetical protein ON010_g7770 [Phytophthora cinnamomi]